MHNHELVRSSSHLSVRNGARLAHAHAKRCLAGHIDVSVLCGFRFGDRLAYGRDRRRELWRVHRAWHDHAVAVDAECRQRVVWHLYAAFFRNDLRNPLCAYFVCRDRDGICRRGRQQVCSAGVDHAGHGAAIRGVRGRASGLDGRVSRVHGRDLQLVRFIIGVWADGFEKLQIIPLMIITPLTFLGGTFYSIKMLPPFWQTVTLFNPVVYLVSGFRWSFFGSADVSLELSIGMTLLFLAVCVLTVRWIFKTGYRLKT
ncbi:ABC transporter permease [Bordetella holmesii H558]|nr:ABC transporter permease [Bordetella holmesii H558]AOB35313.1 ABC transporter permease [Bordetella holmesii]